MNHPSSQDFTFFVTGMHDAMDLRLFQAHLGNCPKCRELLQKEAQEELQLQELSEQYQSCVACEALSNDARCSHCGAANFVGPYKVQKLMTQNARGRMYLAIDQDKNLLALKELAFVQAPSVEDTQFFEREARILRTLNHPSIPRFVDSFKIGNGIDTRFYLVQEFIDGDSLEKKLSNAQWSETEVRLILEQTLEILVYLQDLSPMVFHRDIKPANLMHRNDGRIVLVDFGAARSLGATASATLVGTFGYMPIEQLGGIVDASSDTYALGTSIVHLLTREDPWQLIGNRTLLEKMNVSPQCKKFISKLVAKEKNERFSCAKQALSAFQAIDEEDDTKEIKNSWIPFLPSVWKVVLPALATVVVATQLTIGGLETYLFSSDSNDSLSTSPTKDPRKNLNLTPTSPRNSFSITSTPSGAIVEIDDINVGNTPLLLNGVSLHGNHTIRIKKSGFLDHVESRTMQDENPDLIAVLKERIRPDDDSYATIRSSPVKARLKIDGSYTVSYTPHRWFLTQPLESPTSLHDVASFREIHDIELTAPGYKTYTDVLYIPIDSNFEYLATLEPLESNKGSEPPLQRIQGTQDIAPPKEIAFQLLEKKQATRATVRVCANNTGEILTATIPDFLSSTGFPSYDILLEKTILATWRFAKRERGTCGLFYFRYPIYFRYPRSKQNTEHCNENDPLCEMLPLL